MTRRLRAVVVAVSLAAGLSLGAVVGTATAAPGTGIEKITPRDDSLEVRMSGAAAPTAGSSVSLEYNGIRVPAIVRGATPAPQGAQRSVMLLVDASGSMAGPSMARVKQASAAYLQGVPAGVRVGVARFSDTAAVVVAPTTDRRAVSAAVQNLTPKGSTALYDGLLVAAGSLGTTGKRHLLVLSDGADTASTARLEAALTAISRSGVTVNVITLATDDKTTAVLGRIADAGSGRVVPATDTAGLLRALTNASTTAQTVTVTAPVPAEVAGK
ncbi:MAG: VWA domain-containing protein, partial [Actinomycetota bacterium]|nr:VWA domain-containing protein [Actinomycetota bacterium]